MDVIGIVSMGGSLVWRSPSSVTKEPGHDDDKGTVENYERKEYASHHGHTREGGERSEGARGGDRCTSSRLPSVIMNTSLRRPTGK